MNDNHRFDGDTFDALNDGARLSTQFESVKTLMLDGEWRTLGDISGLAGFPQASISARLRDMRKPRFGRYIVERRRVSEGAGTYEYRVAA